MLPAKTLIGLLGAVSTIAGVPGEKGYQDGAWRPGTVQLSHGCGAESARSTSWCAIPTIRTVSLRDPEVAVSTFLGNGVMKHVSGPANSCSIWHPTSIIADADGSLFIGNQSCDIRYFNAKTGRFEGDVRLCHAWSAGLLLSPSQFKDCTPLACSASAYCIAGRPGVMAKCRCYLPSRDWLLPAHRHASKSWPSRLMCCLPACAEQYWGAKAACLPGTGCALQTANS